MTQSCGLRSSLPGLSTGKGAVAYPVGFRGDPHQGSGHWVVHPQFLNSALSWGRASTLWNCSSKHQVLGDLGKDRPPA